MGSRFKTFQVVKWHDCVYTFLDDRSKISLDGMKGRIRVSRDVSYEALEVDHEKGEKT